MPAPKEKMFFWESFCYLLHAFSVKGVPIAKEEQHLCVQLVIKSLTKIYSRHEHKKSKRDLVKRICCKSKMDLVKRISCTSRRTKRGAVMKACF